MAEVKGVAVQSVPAFIKDKFGEDGFNKWKEALDDDAKKVYGGITLATQWYPLMQILCNPTRKMCELFYSGSPKGAWDSGRFSAEQALKGIYKVFIKLGSAGFLINKASTILPTYYRPSSIEVTANNKHDAAIKISGFDEYDEIIEGRICGWIERALEISGCKNVQVKIVSSMAKGAAATEATMNWV